MRRLETPLAVLTPEILRFLASDSGAPLMDAAGRHRDDPFGAARLREQGWDPELAAAALDQARLRLRARAKFADAGRMWFTASLLEQASGEAVSAWRAKRYAAWDRAGDFCCGLGGDTLALAQAREVVAVDRDPLSLALAAANAGAVGLRERVRLIQGELPTAAPAVQAAWIDPGRRETGRRTRSLEAMSPGIRDVLSLRERVPHLGIKLSPATSDAELDAELERLPHEREFLSLGGQCRELAVWTGALSSGVPRRASVLPAGATLAGAPEPWSEAGPAGPWLIEPDPAVIRAGLVGNLARELGARPVDPQLAYLAADEPARSDLASVFRVEAPEPFSGRALAARLRAAGAGDVVLKTRGAAVVPETLRHQLRGVLKQGKAGRCPVVFLTRIAGRAVMIFGERVGPGASEDNGTGR